jgi:hypothetical protein
MRTTIDLPDEIFRQVKARAALSGLKLKDLVTQFVEQGLKGAISPTAPKRQRSELAVVRLAQGKPLPSLSNAEIEALFVDEEVHGE